MHKKEYHLYVYVCLSTGTVSARTTCQIAADGVCVL